MTSYCTMCGKEWDSSEWTEQPHQTESDCLVAMTERIEKLEERRSKQRTFDDMLELHNRLGRQIINRAREHAPSEELQALECQLIEVSGKLSMLKGTMK